MLAVSIFSVQVEQRPAQVTPSLQLVYSLHKASFVVRHVPWRIRPAPLMGLRAPQSVISFNSFLVPSQAAAVDGGQSLPTTLTKSNGQPH